MVLANSRYFFVTSILFLPWSINDIRIYFNALYQKTRLKRSDCKKKAQIENNLSRYLLITRVDSSMPLIIIHESIT